MNTRTAGLAVGLGWILVAACQSEVPIGYGSSAGALGQPPNADGSCDGSLVLCSGACVAVCGGEPDGGPSPTTAAPDATTDAAPDAAPAGCNTVVAGGALVSFLEYPGSVPAFTGGTLVDGTYDLTAVAVYNGDSFVTPGTPTGNNERSTCVVTGSDWKCFAGNASFQKTYNQTLTPSGTVLQGNSTCDSLLGPSAPGSEGFSATATTITALAASGTTSVVFTYTRR